MQIAVWVPDLRREAAATRAVRLAMDLLRQPVRLVRVVSLKQFLMANQIPSLRYDIVCVSIADRGLGRQVLARLRAQDRQIHLLPLLGDLGALRAVMDLQPSGWLEEDALLDRTGHAACRVLRPLCARIARERQERFTIQTKDATYCVSAQDIACIESGQRRLMVYDRAGQMLCAFAGKLDEVSARLPSMLRCHQSYLVNPACVAQLDRAGHVFRLGSGTVVPISRALYKETMRSFDAYLERTKPLVAKP